MLLCVFVQEVTFTVLFFNNVLKNKCLARLEKLKKNNAYQKIEDNASRCPQFSNYFLSSVSTNSEMMASNLQKKKKEKKKKKNSTKVNQYVHVSTCCV